MANRRIPHLTRTRHGVWHYQRWLPAHLVKQSPTLKPLFRLSLRTTDKQRATRIAHLLSVRIDDLALQYFEDAESFAEAMRLLYESAKAARDAGGNWQEYEERFYGPLDGPQEFFFHKGDKFQTDINQQFEKMQDEIRFLKDALLSGGTAVDPEKLIREIEEKINPPIPDHKNPTLKDAFQSWQEAYKPNMVQTSFDEYSRMIGLFIRIVDDFSGGETRVADLTKEHIRHYHKVFKKIPARVNTDSYTISELAKLKGRPRSPKTIRGTYINVSHFLKFLDLHYDEALNSSLISFIYEGDKIQITDKDRIKRPPFTDDELARLFNSDKYLNGKLKTSGMYWAPLIALFTGARMSEILQLEHSDIKKDKDAKVWYISFDDSEPSEDDDKRLKAGGSKRKVPLHKQLIDLGFLDYVKAIKTARLFPDELRNKKGKFDAFQKRFATYIRQCSVLPAHDREQKGFHNFRHTVRTRLAELGKTGRANERFDEGIIDSIVGHKSKDRSIGQKNYTSTEYINVKNLALNRLEYKSIDFDKIKPWKACDFWGKIRSIA